MSKIRPFWRVVLGLLILSVCVYNTNMLPFEHNIAAFAVWWAGLAAYIFCAVKIPYDDPLRSMRDLMARREAEEAQRREAEQAAEKEKAEARRLELQAAREAEAAAEKARQQEWEQTHGRIVTSIAGVTFKNDDGSSRQAILKDIKASGGGDAELSLEEFEYKGKPAVRVLVDGEQIGNVPRGRVAEILAVLDRIEDARLEVETFRPEEEDDEGKTRRGELIYRADLYLTYTK